MKRSRLPCAASNSFATIDKEKTMFSVTQNGANRVDIVLDGKLDSDAMKVALDELAEKTKNVKNGRMLYRVKDFQLPTMGAMAIEFSRLLELQTIFGSDRRYVRVVRQWAIGLPFFVLAERSADFGQFDPVLVVLRIIPE